MNIPARLRVTSAEFTRQFGQLRQSLGHDPVFITHHGRETHVLLTLARFQESQASWREPIAPGVPSVPTLADWLPQGVIVVDRCSTVRLANPAAHAMLDRIDGQLVGHDLFEAVPELKGSLLQVYLRRALTGREPCSADLPAPFAVEAWTRLDVFPTADGATLLLHDITDDVHAHRLADARNAIIAALAEHGGIGCLRLTPRGHIERIDAAVCALLKLPEQRLIGIAVADLVPLARRAAFREQLDAVLAGQGAARIETALLANDGVLVPVTGGLVELRGVYGVEGAVFVVAAS